MNFNLTSNVIEIVIGDGQERLYWYEPLVRGIIPVDVHAGNLGSNER